MVARQEKLTSVSASMSTIYKDMEEHTKSRRELHENRLVSIEQSITRLEKHFQGSIKTVRDGLKEASEMFDNDCVTSIRGSNYHQNDGLMRWRMP